MKTLRYIDGVATLKLDAERCTGCGVCTLVCPHAVFAIAENRRATIADLDACMECGACAKNCAWSAISLTPGVGCAAAIINGWLHNTEPSCGGPNGCCSGAPAEAESPAQESAAAASCCGDGAVAEAQPDSSCCGGAEAPAAPATSCCAPSPTRPDAPS